MSTEQRRAAPDDDLNDIDAAGRKVLFVASTGGHLAELVRIAPRFRASEDSLWITFDSPQSRSLLRGRRVVHVPYVSSRDPVGVAKAFAITRRAIRAEREPFAFAVSTGSAVSIGSYLAARAAGIPRHFIESASRVDGPSLTGRIHYGTRLARMYTQHSWAHDRWTPFPSVISVFEAVERAVVPDEGRPLRLFVTLGTFKPFRFDRLLDRLKAIGALDDESIVQVGVTTRSDLPGKVASEMPAVEFERACRQADVVITHGGVGTILQLLELGIHPVVVPRLKAREEHVDDHQLEICRLVGELGVAEVVDADALTMSDLRRASALATREKPSPRS